MSASPVETVDVVVVGAGAAGLMAAIEAAELGARVLLLQKLPEAGGKSALAIGSISASGTALQSERGIDDSIERHLADLDRRIAAGTIAPLSLEKLHLVVRHGAEAVARLVELGVRFSGPHPEFPAEVRRMHVVQPDTRTMVALLAQQARVRGVRLRGDWQVDALVTDGTGRIVGVQGPRGEVHATRAVVLATGDFSSPTRLGSQSPVGSEFAFRPWASGDGHHLAEVAGGQLLNTSTPLRPQLRTVDWPHLEPQAALFAAGAILVDRAGNRVVDETDGPAARLTQTGDPEVFVVMDRCVTDRIATAADDSAYARDGWLAPGKMYIGTFPGVAYGYVDDVVRAGYGFIRDDAASLADALGITSAGLAATVAAYGSAVHAGVPDPLGRTDRASALDQGPLFAFGPLRARAILGRSGVRTDADLRPVGEDGKVVAGLLVAGATAGVTGFAYGHGYELAWAVVSGRLAGKVAAASR